MRLRPHQEALCCLLSIGLLLFLNRKTETHKKHKENHRSHLRRANMRGSLGDELIAGLAHAG
jgi:hypothetical protein